MPMKQAESAEMRVDSSSSAMAVLASLNQRLLKMEALLNLMSDQLGKQVQSSKRDIKDCRKVSC